jgi:SAM-dependent methyltransferase
VSVIKKATRKALRRFQSGRAVEVDGLFIPPANIRLGGAHFQDDRDFIESGRADARKLHQAFGIDGSSRILDVGCGVGRLPIGVAAEFGKIQNYTGIDVSRDSIDWCETNIASRYPGTEFVFLDVRNERYNQRGQEVDGNFSLPLEPAYDAIFLYSVFSHMEDDDVKLYLREFRRLIAPGGGLLLTAFVENDVPEMSINPEGYGPLDWDGPLHCVRFSSAFFLSCVEESGFRVEREDHGTETDGQSAFYLRPA